MSIDLNKLTNNLNEALIKETSESLTKFLNDKRMINNMENTKYENHRIRFYCDNETMEKLVNYDGSLIESKVKRVLTGSDEQVNITCQFSTANCGKVVAQQRLINYLINALK